MFFKQLWRYWRAFQLDVEIEQINDRFANKKTEVEEESKSWESLPKDNDSIKRQKDSEILKLSKDRLKALHCLAKRRQIAPEIQMHPEDTQGNLEQADKLENLLRFHAVQKQSLFIGGVALLIAFGSFILSIFALVVSIIR